MRRWILFLVLFGLGLALLFFLRGESREPTEEAERGRGEGRFTELPLDEADGRRVEFSLDGPLSLTIRGGAGPVQRPEVELRAADVDTLGEDAYDLKELEVEILDPDSGVRRATLKSPKARIVGDLQARSPTEEQRGLDALRDARFQDAELVLLDGAPVVPLTFTSPTLRWDVERDGFTSDERVHAIGKGLEAEGTGLSVGYENDQLVLQRDAFVRLTLADGARVRLRSGPDGGLEVRRVERDGILYVDVTAQGGARLETEEAQRFELAASTIHLVGRLPRGGGEVHELVSADAQGDVVGKSGTDEFRAQKADFVFRPGGRPLLATLDGGTVLVVRSGRFESQSASFDFDDQGGLASATLSGNPVGDVKIGEHLAEKRPDLATAVAHVSGAGPLVLTRGKTVDLDLAGPARVEVELAGLELDATERVRATVAEGDQRGELHANGAVVLKHEGATLEGPQVDLHWRLDEQGEIVVDAAAPGATRVKGAAASGETVDLLAGGGLEARWAGGRLAIPAAQAVVLDVAGERSFQARAQQVSGLDWNARSFRAEGEVEFDGADGWGRAQRAVVRGTRDVELYGDENVQAVWAFTRGDPQARELLDARVDAREIRATERRAVARGDARVVGGSDVETLDLRAQSVVIDVAPALPAARVPRPFRVEAEGGVVADTEHKAGRAHVESEWLQVDGVFEPPPADAPPQQQLGRARANAVEARGAVRFVSSGQVELRASADRLVLDGEGRGQLSAGAGRRVEMEGKLPDSELPVELSADWIDFAPRTVRASRVDAKVQQTDRRQSALPALHELSARSFTAEPGAVVLDGDARVAGGTPQSEDWSLEAATIRLAGAFDDPSKIRTEDLRSLEASGGFTARLGTRGVARGDRLAADVREIRMEGRPAELTFLDAEWRSPWIRYDAANMLLATDRGEITSRPSAPGRSWSLEYESMQPFEQGATTILALRNPRFRLGSQQLFADWALFWVDRERWRKSGRDAINESVSGSDLHVSDGRALNPETPRAFAGGPLAPFVSEMRGNGLVELLTEVYLEGNIEVYEVGERTARAAAVYVELVDGHGWIQDADVQVELTISGLPRRVRAKADWLRMSTDGTLRADTAVLSACEYDTPHYVIETRDLRLTPEANPKDERVAYKVSAEGNAIRFEDSFALPLPPLIYETDEEGKPLIDRFVLGNSAKFGAAIGASINAQLGGIGLSIGKLASFALRLPDVPIRGSWNFDVRYLGSRGLLLGAGLDLRLGDEFWLDAQFDVIPDRSSDSGLIRVDRDDRSLLRTWFHARGRYTLERGDDAEWVDLALSLQSDAAVQSEFFERDFLRYEQKDNYVHWRRADGTDYASGSVKVVLEDRTDISELPKAGLFRGRTDIGELWGKRLYHTGSIDAGYFQREEGDPLYYEPFPDGLGEAEVVRADTLQRLELVVPTEFLATQVTPFVEGRAAVWSEGVDPNETPAEAALLAGVQASTTFWRRASGGAMHSLSPTVTVRSDLADAQGGGDPVRFDGTEDPYLGTFAEFGLLGRWWKPEAPDRLQVEVRTAYGEDVEGPADDGFQPIATLAGYRTLLGGFPFAVAFDARYDVRTNETVYSRTLVGIEPWRDVGFEFGHHFGRDAGRDVLYEAASAAVRWRWTSKWEIEAQQTQSLFDSQSLVTEGVLRRLGHDFVLELEVGHRAGEGTFFSIGFEPRLSFRRKSLGLIDQWLGRYH